MNNLTKKEVGQLGESVAAKYLGAKGYSLISRNYRKKWGEIDLITRKGQIYHFIEVKTVSRKLIKGEPFKDGYRAEDNLHPWKIKRLSRAIQSYLLENDIEEEWFLDAATVYLDMRSKKAKVKIIENIGI